MIEMCSKQSGRVSRCRRFDDIGAAFPAGRGAPAADGFETVSFAAQRVALVVEDEWLVRMEITTAFKAAGWSTIEAASGDEAAQFLSSATRVDLLLTDIRLAGSMSGWDLADLFRTARPEGAVIYASANPPIEGRKVPGSEFVGKPVFMSELVEASERLWSHRSN